MAGIYIHIPFCKQACHYCDFHFSTSLKKKPELVEALCKEIKLRKNEIKEKVETIYFGGGTPSLLSETELEGILKTVYENYDVVSDPEITLEANPDDLSSDKIKQLAQSPINRLSIGIQSFYEEDLVWMNRSHNKDQAFQAIRDTKENFSNFSIDLIYGVPGLSDEEWIRNLDLAIEMEIPHISSYALTVEPRTALSKMIKLGKKEPVDDASARRHYEILVDKLTKKGYINYEFSNFGFPGYFSMNNTAYWFGKPYLGIGPSAHGFDGYHRSWNVRNNTKYMKALRDNELPKESETLSTTDRYNEYIMTRLRTMWGISLSEIAKKFGLDYQQFFEKESVSLFKEKLLEKDGDTVRISPKGKFLGDGISAELFYVE